MNATEVEHVIGRELRAQDDRVAQRMEGARNGRQRYGAHPIRVYLRSIAR